jgi:hypothetical protein
MTGYESKKAAAQAKLKDDDTLTIAYQSGYYDGKKAAQPAQEPVAWLCKADENGMFGLPTTHKACKDCFPVYQQSPQRPWVGLTKKEQLEIFRQLIINPVSEYKIFKAYEKALKEKNT